MKTVSAVSGSTLAFSSAVLIGDVEAQTRWSLGSLCAAVLAASASPLQMVITPDSLTAYLNSEGVSAADLESSAPSILLERIEGVSKSRAVNVVIPDLGYDSTFSLSTETFDAENPRHALLKSLVLASTPTFSLLGLINRLETFTQGITDYRIYIDQLSERVYFFDTNLVLLDGFSVGSPVADYVLVDNSNVSSSTPTYGWE